MPRDLAHHPDALRLQGVPQQLHFPWGGPLLHRWSQEDRDAAWAERSNYGYVDSGERGE